MHQFTAQVLQLIHYDCTRINVKVTMELMSDVIHFFQTFTLERIESAVPQLKKVRYGPFQPFLVPPLPGVNILLFSHAT